VPYLPLCVRRCSTCAGEKKKNKSKLIRFNKNLNFHSKKDCSLLGCVLWHQAPLREKILRELQKGDQLHGQGADKSSHLAPLPGEALILQVQYQVICCEIHTVL